MKRGAILSELKRVLSFPVLLLITINSIMGTGIFFLPALGAVKAGPASLISWVLLSIFSIYISMCFAELVVMFPKAGGIYEFCKQAFGKFPSFLIGWATILAGNITIAMLIVGAIVYLLPGEGAEYFQVKALVTFISILFVLAFNYIAYKGMQTSAVMLITFAFITLGTLFSLIFPGLFRLSEDLFAGNLGNFDPFFVFPVSMIFVTVFFISETFFGWETTTFLAEETKDPERDMPRALILGTSIIAVISVLFVIVTLGVIPVDFGWKFFPTSNPLADIAETLGFGSAGIGIIRILVYLSILGSVAGWVVSTPRLILALCRDNLFPRSFGAIHKDYGTPYKAIVFQTILTSILILLGVGSYHTLLNLLLPIALLLYAAVLLSLIVLRFKMPNFKRPYKAPFGLVGPAVTIVFLLSLILLWLFVENDALQTFSLGLAFISVGIPIYFLVEAYYDPKFTRKTNDFFAYLTFIGEEIFQPRSIRKEVISRIGSIKNKKVLEFGSSVGTLTKHLIKGIGKGKIYSTNISKHELDFAKKRLKSHKSVKFIHDVQHHSRVHPKVPRVHVVVSFGAISTVQDLDSVLTHVSKRLHKGGKFCFADYAKFFHILPNVEWLNDDNEINRIFRKNKLRPEITRINGPLWSYVVICGKKV